MRSSARALFKRVHKALQRRFNYEVYNFYTADLNLFSQKPEQPDRARGFEILHEKASALEAFLEKLPEENRRILKQIIYEDNLYCCAVTDSNKQLANYIFYYKNTMILPREMNRKLYLAPDEVFLIAGRTIPGNEGLGLSELGKRYLFHELQNEGFRYAYLMARKKNPLSNHVNQKIGIPLTARYHHVTLFKKLWVMKVN